MKKIGRRTALKLIGLGTIGAYAVLAGHEQIPGITRDYRPLIRGFSDQDKKTIEEVVSTINAKYNIKNLDVVFLKYPESAVCGTALELIMSNQALGAVYVELGSKREYTPSMVEIMIDTCQGLLSEEPARNRVLRFISGIADYQSAEFISLFGENTFEEFKGKNVIVLMPSSCYTKELINDEYSDMKSMFLPSDPGLYFKRSIAHETGHVVIESRFPDNLLLAKKVRETNKDQRFLTDKEKENHVGHVSFSSFHEYGFCLGGSEQAAETFAFYVLNLPYNKQDPILAKKMELVQGFLERFYKK